MYNSTGTLVRSIIAIIIGIVLVKWPDTVNNTIVTALGILFIIPLLATLMAMIIQNAKNRKIPVYSLIGCGGSAILGLIMILIPQAFTNLLALLFGCIMIFAGARQVIAITPYKKQGASYLFYIVPAVLIIIGIITIANFRSMISTLWIIVGIISIIYGINEIFNMFRFRAMNNGNLKNKNIEDAEIIN
ncbi:MAG: DUF308 domain-containing protein [Bacteroidales bacterium]